MTSDTYLQRVLRRITAPTGAYGPGAMVRDGLHPTIAQWAGSRLAGVELSGSYAKGTAIVGGTDVDLFLSIKSDTRDTLKEIFDGLAAHMVRLGFRVRKQNVSVGIQFDSYTVDLVPGKRQNFYTSDHSIWVSRQGTWQKTNVENHIRVIIGSSHRDVILLMKRWRQLRQIEMPSFVLELAVLRALEGRANVGLASKMLVVLEFLRDRIVTTSLLDPANSNNNVADDLTSAEKLTIARQARASREAGSWEDIVR